MFSAVWLNHWLQGAMFSAVISGDNLAKTRPWLFYQQGLAETQAWIKDWHAAWYSASQLSYKVNLGSWRQQFPILVTIPCWRKGSPQGLTKAAPFTCPITPIPVSSHSWMQDSSLPRAAIRLLRSEKQCMNHQGMFSVLEWLTVEIRAEFNWELIPTESSAVLRGARASPAPKKHPQSSAKAI